MDLEEAPRAAAEPLEVGKRETPINMKTPEQLTEQLKESLGGNLLSVVLFGSSVRGDRSRLYSDHNILVVLKQIGVSDLRRLAPLSNAWMKQKNPAPLLFTEQHLRDASDVFPLEFLDIQESHRILFGSNPFEQLTVSTENMRHQLEYELRSKLIQLRQRFMETEGRDKRIHELLARSFSTFIALFKGVLRMAGQPVPKNRLDVLSALEKLVPIDQNAFEGALLIRDGAAHRADANLIFEKFLTSIEGVVDFVNNYK